MKKINILLILAVLILSSCARGCQSLEKEAFDNKKHKVRITQYSGGRIINQWEIYGIVNDAKGSDGYFFYKDNKLIEVSGDIKLEYLD